MRALDGMRAHPLAGLPVLLADEPVTTELLPLRTLVIPAIEDR